MSFMTVAGLKKCMPMNRSARLVAEASSVGEMEEVLVAKMASGFTMVSSCRKRSFLMLTFSTMASTIRSASAAWRMLVVKTILAEMASASACVLRPFSTCRAREAFSRSSPF